MKTARNRTLRAAFDGRANLMGCLALTLLLLAPAAAAEDPWKFKWSNGFKLDSPDGMFKLKFGGRIMADWSFASADNALEDVVGTVEDGNEFRRARLFFSGTIYGNVEFKAQYDFAGGEADAKDLYIGLKGTPIGGIRFGHFKEPFSLEEITSSKYLAFQERSLPVIFAPSRNMGIMVHDKSDRLTWAFGIFREADDFGFSSGDGNNITGRVTGTPIYEEKGKRLVHLGVSATRKDLPSGGTFRVRQRPEAHISPRFVNTGRFDADDVTSFALELATVQGPFWAAAEYMSSDVSTPGGGDPTFGGFYVQAGYYFTGEHRRYKTSSGAFDRQKPKENFSKDGGKGAWEIAARYSTLDLTDGVIDGGEIDNVTLALNWYLNPATRFMVNYVTADRDGVGDANFLLVRWQVDF